MPKVKPTIAETCTKLQEEYGKENYDIRGENLYCKICNVSLSNLTRYQINRHEKSVHHNQVAAIKRSSDPSPSPTAFNDALCSAMIAADIPLWKLQNHEFKTFLEKYTQNIIPDESTFRKNYVQKVYEKTMASIREAIGDHSIWISIDETTDVTGRFVANVIVGSLENGKPGKHFLLTSEKLEKTNHATIAELFRSALKLLWPFGFNEQKVLLFLSDAAPYMKKAGKELKKSFSKMIHVTCLAHGLHRIAEQVRDVHSNVDTLISCGKKVFLKAPSRVHIFREMAPDVPLPPQPIITRWGTWLNAAIYYSQNFDIVKQVVEKLPSEAASITTMKKCFQHTQLRCELNKIEERYGCLVHGIKKLETIGLSLKDALMEIQKISTNLNKNADEKVREKATKVLNNNEGYGALVAIHGIFESENKSLPDTLKNLQPGDIPLFEFAPTTSCDVERSFSQYKIMLTDNRQGFMFENLRKHLVIRCFHANGN